MYIFFISEAISAKGFLNYLQYQKKFLTTKHIGFTELEIKKYDGNESASNKKFIEGPFSE